MVYQISKTFIQNGSIDNLESSKLILQKGLIYKIEIYFPPGSMGNTYVRVMEKDSQIYPCPRGEFFRGDNLQIQFGDRRFLETAPYEIEFQGYNIDTKYDHTVVMRIGFLGRDDLIKSYVPDTIEKLLTKLSYQQEEEDRRTRVIQLEKVRKSIKGIMKK